MTSALGQGFVLLGLIAASFGAPFGYIAGARRSAIGLRWTLAGVLCRCTGYRKPVEAVLTAARRMRDGAGSAAVTQGGGGASS